MAYVKKKSKGHASKTVAIAIPLHNRSWLTPEEEISLKHLTHFLGRYDKYLVMPKSLKFDLPGYYVKRFDNKFFGSREAYKKLMFSPIFYEQFLDYKYILVYQLDCLVFSDQLLQWCETDLDYIGAPWLKHKDSPNFSSAYENKVGNSGFSLRKVESFLKMLYSTRSSVDLSKYWSELYKSKGMHIKCMIFLKLLIKSIKLFNNINWELSRYPANDDAFFANRAEHYYPEFKIASVETALGFAFECVPRYCFEVNKYTLPFGCHAWHKYDKDFWEPYLLK